MGRRRVEGGREGGGLNAGVHQWRYGRDQRLGAGCSALASQHAPVRYARIYLACLGLSRCHGAMEMASVGRPMSGIYTRYSTSSLQHETRRGVNPSSHTLGMVPRPDMGP